MDKTLKRNFSKIGLAYLVFVGASQILSTILMMLIYTFFSSIVPDTVLMRMILLYAATYLIAFPLFLLVMHFIPNQELPPSMNVKVPFHQIFMLFFVGMSVTIIVSLAFNFLFLLFSGEPYNPIADVLTELDLVPVLIFTCIIAPIIEEIIFRKVLYKKISAYGSTVYMVSSALFFSLFHLNLSQSTYAFFLGLVLAWIMYRTGNIIYPILFHFAANVLGGSISLFLLEVLDETVAIMISGILNLFVFVLGIVFAIFIGINIRNGKFNFFHKGNLPKPNWSTVFANPGYILFISIIGVLILFAFAIDILARIGIV